MSPIKTFACPFFVIFIFCALQCTNFTSAQAQEGRSQPTITPSHVYQSTEELRLKLESLGLIDMQAYESEPPDTALRHPRHVMQKVRECHQIFSKMLRAKNIEPEPLPDLYSMREVRPSDVRAGVLHLLEDVEKLGKTDHAAAPFIEGKLPGDVYNNLKRICHAVTYEITPADVYQVAFAVRENAEKIAKGRGYDIQITQEKFESKIPADVYQEAWRFLDDLRLLALNPDFSIPGGVVIPNDRQEHDIKPQHVMSLMNDALSGTDAIKYTLNVHEKTEPPSFNPDKTPSDVFGEIHHAHAIIKKILEREEALERGDAE